MAIEHSSRIIYALIPVLALIIIIPYGLQPAHAACTDPPSPGVDYSGCDLTSMNIDFNNLDLSGANLSGADISNLELRNVKLIGANLDHAIMDGVVIENANLTNAVLTNAEAIGINLQNGILTHADFTGAIVSRADFTNSDITFVNFSGADLTFADFTDAYVHNNIFDNNTQFGSAKFIRTDLSSSDLSGLDLSGLDFDGANFTGSNLAGTKLLGSTFTCSTTPSGQVCVNFNNANLSGADLTGATVNGATFVGTNLSGATLLCTGDPVCSSTDAVAPIVTPPPNQTSPAGNSLGAFVFYPAATATDNVGVVGQVLCSPSSGSQFPIGLTTVICSAHDAAGNIGTASFTVTVQDTTPPTVTVPSSITKEATGASGATVTYTATATDNVGVVGQVLCNPSSGSQFALGTINVSCSAHDAAGNIGTASFTVTVKDTTPPTVTVPSSITKEATGASGATVTYTVSATDLVDGNTPIVSCNPPSGSQFALGNTTVSCNTHDTAGNIGTASFTVTVKDTTKPLLIPPVSITTPALGPLTVLLNGLGTPTVSDAVDPHPTVTNNAPSGGFPPGSTTVTWTAVDSSGNVATATQLVTITVLGDIPTITAPPAVIVEATGPLTTVSLGTPTVSDAVDPHPTVTNNAPSGGFPIGNSTVIWTATNLAHNSQSASQSVTVKDTTPPTIIAPPVTAEATNPNGATVTYTVSATDLVDGTDAVTCDHLSGSQFVLGSTTVLCNATDHAGNSAHTSFTVTVKDTTPPTIIAPPVTAEATNPNGATVTYTVSATDLVDGTDAVTCSPPSGTSFGIGSTPVQCSAHDVAGNVRTVSFSVIVKDTTPPTITAPPAITIQATGPLTTVNLGTPTVSDIVDQSPTVTNNAPSGGFSAGTTTVTWAAKDSSGNVATALQIVTVIPKNTPGKITGGGQIEKGTNFGFEVKSYDGVHFTGNLEFNDKSPKIDLDSKSITGLFVDTSGKQGTFDGTATLNGKNGYTFHIYVEDNGEPGTHDVFKIQIFNSTGGQIYSNGGTIISGNIQIHKSAKDTDDDHGGHGDDNHGSHSGDGDHNSHNTGDHNTHYDDHASHQMKYVSGDYGKVGDKIHFEYNVQSEDDHSFKGFLTFEDKSSKVSFSSTSVNSLSLDSGKSSFSGDAKFNGKTGYTYKVNLVHDDKHSNNDSYSISAFDGKGHQVYTNQNKITNGSLKMWQS